MELCDRGATDEEALHPLCVSQLELAGMIGATRESVNKELNILRKKGLVQTSRNRITILDLARLKRRIR